MGLFTNVKPDSGEERKIIGENRRIYAEVVGYKSKPTSKGTDSIILTVHDTDKDEYGFIRLYFTEKVLPYLLTFLLNGGTPQQVIDSIENADYLGQLLVQKQFRFNVDYRVEMSTNGKLYSDTGLFDIDLSTVEFNKRSAKFEYKAPSPEKDDAFSSFDDEEDDVPF